MEQYHVNNIIGNRSFVGLAHFESLSTIRATNEPKRQSCGAPDYILTKKDIPVGFIEAKDIGDKDLEGAKKNRK
ncbi:MAG: hypothetical protein U5K51_06480 [Flavobacteriaceae bacterium]|nr:hypothetical protein [Flavobacteriaceae bacterium]